MELDNLQILKIGLNHFELIDESSLSSLRQLEELKIEGCYLKTGRFQVDPLAFKRPSSFPIKMAVKK